MGWRRGTSSCYLWRGVAWGARQGRRRHRRGHTGGGVQLGHEREIEDGWQAGLRWQWYRARGQAVKETERRERVSAATLWANWASARGDTMLGSWADVAGLLDRAEEREKSQKKFLSFFKTHFQI